MAAPRAAAPPSGPAKAYMTLYNVAQFLGWSYIMFCAVSALRAGSGSPGVWQAVEVPLKIFQTAAILEALHCALGLVRASVFTTGMQVASRVGILWAVVDLVPDETTQGSLQQLGPLSPSFTSLIMAWSLVEIIRYGFFAAKALGLDSYVLLWLRYSAFLPLYPLGVASEITMALLALPQVRRRKLLSIEMPNSWNFAFDYHTALIILIGVYLPGFPYMFFHMVRQRRKYLGSGAREKSA